MKHKVTVIIDQLSVFSKSTIDVPVIHALSERLLSHSAPITTMISPPGHPLHVLTVSLADFSSPTATLQSLPPPPMSPQWVSAMKSKQDDGLHSIHATSAPVRPADSSRTFAAAAAATATAAAASKASSDPGFSPPSSGSTSVGFGQPAKRDDSRDNVSSPGTPKGSC